MTIEDAYRAIARNLVASIGDEEWDEAIDEIRVLDNSCRSRRWYIRNGEKIPATCDRSIEISSASSKAVMLIRDEISSSSGGRVWGVTFRLYPNGKFGIDFDYEKPDGYME
ncbi:hypothetical protein [Agaribacterium haliotis]|uniref:hypothetical protein n=1 Tax=Agaribacterium haliotis TaxID=2013869 RepID=UPI000BB58A2E|nr:hypothetical protein [Agaribacterium haliotis]